MVISGGKNMKSRNPRKSLAEMTVKPSFCNISLKLAMLENQDTTDQQIYPARLTETTIITKSAMNFLDLLLNFQENDVAVASKFLEDYTYLTLCDA
jgi:hypothetical protein